jgi:class 3 adenylate cyclase
MLAHLVNTDRQRKLASEFRPVAAQFIHIVGLETLAIRQGAKLATAVLQRYFVRAEEIITQHEGVISQVDAYAQGFFLLNTFGTPKAHEGTTRYAVSAALQLAKALEQINREFKLDPPLKQRGGITYGLVFNGEVGAKYRRESVVAGPAVNRAARLMSKAQFGQVILDTEIWEDTRNAFVGEELPSVKLKGIEGQVVIVNVHELRRGTRLQPLERPLLGREVEQTRLAQAREALLYRQQGSAWLVYGETGLGKSSLILDLAQKAQQHGLTILAGRCQPHAKNIPLFVWTDLLTGWLDVDESADPAKERVRLAAQLELLGIPEVKTTLVELLALPENGEKAPATRIREPQMPRPQRPVVKTSGTLLSALNRKVGTATKDEGVAKSPGLNTLLGSRLAQTTQNGPTLWKRLEERVTGPAVIIKLIQQLARKQPLLLILEDVHWLDCESEAVLHKLLAQTPELPLLLVLTSRKSFDQPNLSSLELSRLSASAITQVAQRAFGAQALDGSLAEWICNQANGNPLYAEELCQALRQADAVFLDRGAGEVHWTKQAPDLPLSLHELMLARLDELPLPQQDMLKRAAVIGVSFEAEALQRLSAGRLAESDLQSSLERVIQEGFVVETQPQNYRFNHPLMQEAIYTTLSFSQRQIWHTEIGHWLMERRPDLVELIAYHYLRGDDAPKAAQAALKAGHKAQEQGAYTGALEYYEQVLALPTVSIEAKMTATERQGDILMVQKDYSAAKQAYAQAIIWGSRTALAKQAILMGDLEGLGLVEFPAPLRPWAEASRAWLLAQNRQPDLALQSAQAAVALAEGSAQEILRTLLQSLEKQEPMASYEEWLYQFSQLNLLK